jgi:hypothetical protein
MPISLEKQRIYAARWRGKHRAKVRSYAKAYYQKHLLKMREGRRKATAKWLKSEKGKTYMTAYGKLYKCFSCGLSFDGRTMHSRGPAKGKRHRYCKECDPGRYHA